MVYRVPAVPWNCWNLKLKASNSRQCNYLEMNVVLEIPWKVLEYNLLILENFDWLMEILQQNQQVIFQHWIWFVLDMISISQSKKLYWLTECLSVHWHCRLGIRKNIQSVKIDEVLVSMVWLSRKRGADCLHMVLPSQNPIISCLILKSRLVLPFSYQLTQVVLEKRSLNRYSSNSSWWKAIRLNFLPCYCEFLYHCYVSLDYFL